MKGETMVKVRITRSCEVMGICLNNIPSGIRRTREGYEVSKDTVIETDENSAKQLIKRGVAVPAGTQYGPVLSF